VRESRPREAAPPNPNTIWIVRGCRAARLSDKANCAWFAPAKGVRHRVVHKAIRPLALRIDQHETALRTQEAALLYPCLEPLRLSPTTYAITREYPVLLWWLVRLTLNAKRRSFDDHAPSFLEKLPSFLQRITGLRTRFGGIEGSKREASPVHDAMHEAASPHPPSIYPTKSHQGRVPTEKPAPILSWLHGISSHAVLPMSLYVGRRHEAFPLNEPRTSLLQYWGTKVL
jgi:hypothetical protein